MKNQQHNDYIIDLNNRAASIVHNLTELKDGHGEQLKKNKSQDYYYSIYSLNQKKILDSNIIGNDKNLIRFNYTISHNDDFLIVSIYEKELNYFNLIKIMCYIIVVTYLSGLIILYLIDRKKLLVKEVEDLHFMDSLTQLYNKAKFTQSLEKRIVESEPFYVIVTDIEDFKRINQLSGYDVGDILLKNYALNLKLKKMIHNPARIGGNQFIFYIDESDLIKKSISEVLENMVAEIYVINDYSYNIKQNIGYIKSTTNNLDAAELIKFAEIAMHQAQDNKKSIEVYEDKILQQINKTNLIKRELLNALHKNELFLVYQPKVNILTNEIYAEVLVRWKNEKLGFIAPDIFIEIAEKTGEIYKLGKWIFEEAIKEIAFYQKEGKVINLSINLSPKQLLNKSLYNDFSKIIEDNKVPHSQITLELTESVMLNKSENLDLLQQFNKDGIKISIDDFGKGYSSFSYLKDYPVSEIKLDKNFVDEIEKPFNAHLVESISDLSKKLNVSLVIEGVERKEQEDILISLGCNFFQGYYYSKPLEKNDFKKYIENKTT